MAPKFALIALALCAMALAGCTSGSDNDDGDSTTSETGGIGGGVTGPGGVGGNATVSGSASGSSTNSSTNGTDAPDSADVTLASTAFSPKDVTIKMGGTVTWTHNDGTQKHTVTSDDAAWDSHPSCASPITPISDCMDSGDKFEQTFPTVGTFAYHCKIHTSMTGVVNVVA
ncbi:MAG TPA: plastocyanin/azurin family copper-binding protein [Candidatus Thermoplasmatota archaeon]|nr:plastocyanin/azurin family copper-binding protein [Candidatus Thermoplasmatota archaeon]